MLNFHEHELVLDINFKMQSIVGFLKFIARTNNIVCCPEHENFLIYFYSDIYEINSLHVHVNWEWKSL